MFGQGIGRAATVTLLRGRLRAGESAARVIGDLRRMAPSHTLDAHPSVPIELHSVFPSRHWAGHHERDDLTRDDLVMIPHGDIPF